MKLNPRTLLTALLLLCSGCTFGVVSKGKPSEIKLGMTTTEVVERMGKPLNISASGNEEVYRYNVAHSRAIPILAGWETYVFRFNDGKLVSFGGEKEAR
jgi:hypothetical protein